jgi:hypothetical protein
MFRIITFIFISTFRLLHRLRTLVTLAPSPQKDRMCLLLLLFLSRPVDILSVYMK